MKNLLYTFIVLFLVNCKQSAKKMGESEIITANPISKTETSEIKSDTIKKISKPFKLNDILCYWENYIVNGEEIDINLKNFKTKQKILAVIMQVSDFESADIKIDSNRDDLFNDLNNKFFEDLNFDGFKDFYFYSKGSMAMTSSTNIYLFNNKTKSFEYSEYLDAISIDQIDNKSRKLVTTSFDRDSEITKTHYFDKFGKLKYTEEITEYSNPTEYKIYKKIVNGKVVKRDSL